MSPQRYAVVTGGAGFIGSHMVDLLLSLGYRVGVVDNLATGRRENLRDLPQRGDCELYELDVRDLPREPRILASAEFVFHFAGLGDIVPSIEQPLRYMQANVDGTLAVLEAARAAGVRRLVYAASSSCYGAHPPLPTSEDAPISPEYPYALSKYLGELSALHWSRVYRLPVVSIRMFNVYGPRVRTTGAYGAVLGVFLAQKLNGSPLTVVGDGTQSRDFVYVTDVVRAFLLAAESEVAGEVFNLGSGSPQTVNRLVELIGGQQGQVVHVPKRPGEPDCTWADITKIRRVLGWEPTIGLETGVAALMDDIQAWKDAPVWTPKAIEAATKTWFEYLRR